jgi:GNAT superfamily N-acetyltransferase
MGPARPLRPPAALAAAGVSLRPCEASDEPFLRRLYRAVRWDEFAPMAWPDAARAAFLDDQFDFQHRHYAAAFPNCEYYVIAQDAGPIGRLYIDRETRDLRLVEISLLPERRGRGLGAALLAMLQQEVRDGRCDRVGLSVLATNPARRLYARLGFYEAPSDEAFPGPYLEMMWPPGALAEGVTP